MDINEYLKVKDMTYLEYCDYLQDKYGIGRYDYMTKSWNKNHKCTRTNEGLIAHHKAEDKMIMLSTKEIAQKFPFEWQQKENIIYCDYLEHLLLHVLICIYPNPNKVPIADVGIGGVINFIVPELNDLYSGWKTNQVWRQNCHNLVKNDKDVYLVIMQKFIKYEKKHNRNFEISMLYKSMNDNYGNWKKSNDKLIFKEISALDVN